MVLFGRFLVARELKPAVAALEEHGIHAVSTPCFDSPSFVAVFRREKKFVRLVKDRGYWFIDGEEEALKDYPSRASLKEATADAIEWMTNEKPNICRSQPLTSGLEAEKKRQASDS